MGRLLLALGAGLSVASLAGVADQVAQPGWVEPPLGFYALLAAGAALAVALGIGALVALWRDRFALDVFLLLGAGWAFALAGVGRFGAYDWYLSLDQGQNYGYPLWIPSLGVAAAVLLALGALAMLVGLLVRVRRAGRGAAAPRAGRFAAAARGAVVAGCLLLIAAAAGFAAAVGEWYPELLFADFDPNGLYLIVAAGCLLAAIVALVAAIGIAADRTWVDLFALAGIGWAFGLAAPERTEIYEWYAATAGDLQLPYGSWVTALALTALAIASVGALALAVDVASRGRRAALRSEASTHAYDPT